MKATNHIYRNLKRNYRLIVLVTLMTLMIALYVTPAFGYIEVRDYLGRVTKTTYMPLFILYDPPGDKSTQSLTISAGFSFTVSVSYEAGGNVETKRSVEQTISFESRYFWSSSPVSDNPDDIGPGKGDRIVCLPIAVTYDVYAIWLIIPGRGGFIDHYELYLVSQSPIGGYAALSRSDLEADGVHVPDKTGQDGAYELYWEFSANTPTEYEVTYE